MKATKYLFAVLLALCIFSCGYMVAEYEAPAGAGGHQSAVQRRICADDFPECGSYGPSGTDGSMPSADVLLP